jgi:2-iminobutanoate/2-iminopropanoate deaminase
VPVQPNARAGATVLATRIAGPVNTAHDIGVAARIGTYSDAVEVAPGARWLAISGTPGIAPDGSIAPGFDEQAEQAWSNVCEALSTAGFAVGDLVKITQYLTDADTIAAHAAIRARYLGSARPASMLVVVPALVWPEMSIEIEAWAARPA